ncbi:MAG: response regulator [Bosea sp.]|nr:response regulator [Bosea sp. (in: a-proteobacteria)]
MSNPRPVLRVLIADKNAFYRRVVRQYLVPFRHSEMMDVESPLEAISLLLTQPFDLMVVDWELLIGNDGALLELIVRRARLARRKMPVMALMELPTQSSVLHASNNAVDMVLRKPFSPKTLQVRAEWLLAQVVEEIAS